MKRLICMTFVATLLSLGLWQTSQGCWIYVKAQLAQYLLKHAWARTIDGERGVKPWPWADTWPIGRMRVPNLDVDTMILANANGRTLAFGPGHESISSPPGYPGTTILSGHRDTHFRFLERLNRGDRIIIEHPNGRSTAFRVQETDIVEAHETVIHLTLTQKYLVLVTCYPFEALTPRGTLRYVVTALAEPPGLVSRDFPSPPHRFSYP